MRDHLNITLHQIRYKNGSIVRGASVYERNIREPRIETALVIAESLKVNPDLLLYSFGILPKEDKEIIKSDPYFYMEKIKEMCNNHNNRYGKEDVDLYSLNVMRVSDYIKSNKGKKKNVTK
jgi:hypothetical protein